MPPLPPLINCFQRHCVNCSGGLPIRQNRQLPKARHGAGARPCIVFMLDVHVFVKQHKLVDLVQYIVLVESMLLVKNSTEFWH